MHSETIIPLSSFWRRPLLVLFIGLLPLAGCADDKAATAPAPAAATVGDSATMDDVLEELKAIRQVLEKIEKQGMGGGPQRPARPTTATVTIGGKKPVMGSASAPVTVVEFADYQCPFCLRFTKTTFPYLKRDFIDTGKVRWVALNMPLSFHKDAKKAAQAAHCAGEQGKFWEMREELFKNREQLGEEFLPKYAATVGVDVEAFKACLASDRHIDEIDQDARDGGAVGLTGTPSFIIGKTASDKISGQVVIGAQPLNVFSAAIKKALGEDDAAEKPAPAKPADK